MHAGLDVVFEPVPRANDVWVRFVEGEAVAFAAAIDDFPDARNQFALTNGTALVRADILPGIELALHTEDPDGFLGDVDHQATTLGDAVASANVDSFGRSGHIFRWNQVFCMDRAYCMPRNEGLSICASVPSRGAAQAARSELLTLFHPDVIYPPA